MVRLAAFDRGQPLDCALVQCADGQPINGLRGKGHNLAFRQSLYRLVDYVAQVVRVPEIDYNGCHSPQ